MPIIDSSTYISKKKKISVGEAIAGYLTAGSLWGKTRNMCKYFNTWIQQAMNDTHWGLVKKKNQPALPFDMLDFAASPLNGTQQVEDSYSSVCTQGSSIIIMPFKRKRWSRTLRAILLSLSPQRKPWCAFFCQDMLRVVALTIQYS